MRAPTLPSPPLISCPPGCSALHHQWSKPPMSPRAISMRGGLPTQKRIISLSGDGGFLFCAQELETAV